MIAVLVIAVVLLVVLGAAWRYDRRHGRPRVGQRTAEMDIRLAENRFESQNPQGRAGGSVL
jgi:hypothetical protein